MEEKKQIKISLKIAVILILVILIVIAIIVGIIIAKKDKLVRIEIIAMRRMEYQSRKAGANIYEGNILGKDEGRRYYKLLENYDEYENYVKDIDVRMEELMYDYYSRVVLNNGRKDDDRSLKRRIESYKQSDYHNYKETFQERAERMKGYFENGGYTEKFFDEYSLLLIRSFDSYLGIEGIYIKDNILKVYLNELDECGLTSLEERGDSTIFFITLRKDDIKNIETISVQRSYEQTNSNSTSTSVTEKRKPIIYLYPTKETEVEVKLMNKDNITVSYPKYTDGWKVIAKPDGTLTDLDTNRELYALYYESENAKPFKIEKDGFVVKGEDTIKFLEEKLAILGLNEREAEEFIVYWLPILESNKYNYIRFVTEKEINENMPLEISPKPDTTIRILMSYKGLNEPIEVVEQKLETPERQGFVAVEWGGTEIR